MIKSIILASIIFLITCSAFATELIISKGSKIIGVSGYFMQQSGDLYGVNNKKIITTHIAPNIFFFVSKGIFFGPEVMYFQHSRYNYKEKQYGIGPRIGFILNASAASNNLRQYSLFYFSLFTTYSKQSIEETIWAPSYSGYSGPYDFISDSRKFTYGLQLGVYNMIKSHFAIDVNLRLSVDKNNLRLRNYYSYSDRDMVGYTIMLGLGVVGFNY